MTKKRQEFLIDIGLRARLICQDLKIFIPIIISFHLGTEFSILCSYYQSSLLSGTYHSLLTFDVLALELLLSASLPPLRPVNRWDQALCVTPRFCGGVAVSARQIMAF